MNTADVCSLAGIQTARTTLRTAYEVKAVVLNHIVGSINQKDPVLVVIFGILTDLLWRLVLALGARWAAQVCWNSKIPDTAETKMILGVRP